MIEFRVTFEADATVTQTIRLNEGCTLTPEEVVKCLKGEGEHTLATTLNKNAEVLLIKPDGTFEPIGKVIDNDIDGEYRNYELAKD